MNDTCCMRQDCTSVLLYMMHSNNNKNKNNICQDGGAVGFVDFTKLSVALS